MAGRRALITGISGFLGSNLAGAAAGADYEVFGTYHHHACRLPGVTGLALDVTDRAALAGVVRDVRPDVIFHVAAVSRPDECAKDPDSCHAVNVRSVAWLAEAAGEAQAKVIFTSSDLVYGDRAEWTSEKDVPRPLGVYAAGKLAAEELLLAWPDLRVAVARCGLMYGWPRGRAGNFAADWVRQLRAGQALRAFSDQYRCAIWIEDLCEALLRLAEGPLQGVFNLAGPERDSRYRFALALAGEFGLDQHLVQAISLRDFVFADPRPAECNLDIERARAALGWSPRPISQGLRRMREIEAEQRRLASPAG